MEKGRLLEPKSPSAQNPVYGAGIQKETEGVALVSTRHSPPATLTEPVRALARSMKRTAIR